MHISPTRKSSDTGIIAAMALAATMLLTAGCGRSDNSAGGSADVDDEITTTDARGQAVLGPIAGATVEVYNAETYGADTDTSTPVATTTTAGAEADDSLEGAGFFSFDNPDVFDDDLLYEVFVFGGADSGAMDLDTNDDGVRGPEAPFLGEIHLLATGAELTGEFKVNALTEVVYQIVRPYIDPDNVDAVLEQVDAAAMGLLDADLNEDGDIDRADLLAFTPQEEEHRDAYIPGEQALSGLNEELLNASDMSERLAARVAAGVPSVLAASSAMIDAAVGQSNLVYVLDALEDDGGGSTTPVLSIVDVSNPLRPVLMSNFELGTEDNGLFETVGIAVAQGTDMDQVYVSSDAGIAVIDVSTADDTRGDAAFHADVPFVYAGDYIGDITVSGDYLYAALGEDGLGVVDISDLTMPTAGDTVAVSVADAFAEQVTATDAQVYLTLGEDGLVIFDINNEAGGSAAAPVELATYSSADGGTTGKAVGDNGNIYISFISSSDDSTRLEVLQLGDETEGSFPVNRVGSLSYAQGQIADLAVVDDRVYLAATSGLQVIDVSTPAMPTELFVVNGIPGADSEGNLYARSVSVVGQQAFVTYDSSGFYVFDVSRPPIYPTLISSWSLETEDSASAAISHAAAGDNVYVSLLPDTDIDTLYTLDIDAEGGLTAATDASVALEAEGDATAVYNPLPIVDSEGDYLYLVRQFGTVDQIGSRYSIDADGALSADATWAQTLAPTGDRSRLDVAVHDDIVFWLTVPTRSSATTSIATGSDVALGFHDLSASAPAYTEITHTTEGLALENAETITTNGEVFVISYGDRFDVYELAVTDATSEGGSRGVTIGGADTATMLGSIAVPTTADGDIEFLADTMAMDNNLLYLGTGLGEVVVYDISAVSVASTPPGVARQVGFLETPNTINHMSVDGGRLFISNDASGLYVFRALPSVAAE